MFDLTDLPIIEPFGRSRLRRLVIIDRFGQAVRVDAERERLEIHIADVARRNETYILIEIVLSDLQDGFGLVVQFRSQMAPRVVVALVQV